MARLFLYLILATNIATFAFYIHQWNASENIYERDFLAFYAAARLPFDKLYSLDAQHQIQKSLPTTAGMMPFVNPPFIVLVLRVFVSDDYVTSYHRWRAFLLFVSLLNGVLLFLILKGFDWTRIEALTGSLTGLMLPAVYSSIVKGQLSALIVCGVLLCVLALQTNREKTGGATLALTLIKPHMALPLLASLIRSKPLMAIAFALAGSGLAIISLIMIGPSGVANLLHANSAVGGGVAAGQSEMVNLLGLLLRLGVEPQFALPIAWIAYFASLLFCGLWKRDAMKGLGIGLLCAVFFAPHVHFHDLYLLLPVMAIAANALRECGYATAYCILLFAPLSLIYLIAQPLIVLALLVALSAGTLLRHRQLPQVV